MTTRTTVRVASVIGLVGLTVACAGTAHADVNPGNTTTLAVVGSDTTQDVSEGLAKALKIGGNPVLSNYKATPVGRTVTTRTGNANCVFTVPKNSGEGRDALSAAMRGGTFAGSPATGGTAVTSPNMTGCVDVARMSSFTNPATSPGVGTMTGVPFATDSLTYAALPAGSVPHALNLNDLKAIYTANTGSCIYQPLLPAAGSGTRSFWKTLLSITTDQIGVAGGWGTCVKDVDGTGKSIQEHDGRFVTNGQQLVPFSTAQAIAQAGGVISDIRGRSSLGSIDFDGALGSTPDNQISPVTLQTSFGAGTRSVYFTVPTAQLTGSTLTNQVFGGPTSLVCTTGAATVRQYGLAPLPTSGAGILCGDTTTTNTN